MLQSQWSKVSYIGKLTFIKPQWTQLSGIVCIIIGIYCNVKHNHDNESCVLTHWGRVTHICVSELTIIGSDNGLSPERRQAIIWTSAGILLIGPLGTNFSEISIAVQTFSFKKMHLKMASAKWRPLCRGLNVLSQLTLWKGSTVVSSAIWPSPAPELFDSHKQLRMFMESLQ